jgi:AraC family transcriptional regulator of adaptative response/methylated-DNA-[protein]-cysteine methyltransferase
MESTTRRYSTDAERWVAVSTRDTRADGAFVYSVRTTGVYSRASCVARPARRENVMFFATAGQARAAGFRPCRRCRPDEPSLAERNTEVVTQVCRAIDRADRPLSLDELAVLAGFSRFHFHRLFKAVTGVTPWFYVSARRAQRVQRELSSSTTVTEAIYSAGFNSDGHFYGTSSAILGMTPTDLRSGGAGARILFHVVPCSLGSVLVATADRGVCTVMFGDNPGALADRLAYRFPNAELVHQDEHFGAEIKRTIDRAERTIPNWDLPRDVLRTILRQLVGDALRTARVLETPAR